MPESGGVAPVYKLYKLYKSTPHIEASLAEEEK